MNRPDGQILGNTAVSAVTQAELTVVLLTDTSVWQRDKIRWDAWCAQAPHPSFFCTTDWLETWWETYGGAVEPWILQVKRGDAVVGYAPLMRIVRHPVPLVNVRSIEFIGTGERVCPEYLDVISVPGEQVAVRRAVSEFLTDCRNEWDRLWLSDGLAGDSLSDYVANDNQHGSARRKIQGHVCPYIDLADNWDTLLAGIRPHMRRKIRQIANRIEREQKVTWRVHAADDDPAHAVQVMTDLHTRARQLKGEAGNFIDPVYQRLHTALIRRTAQSDQLYLGFLELGGTPATFYYGFRCGSTFFNYQTGYNPEFARYRPGWYALSRMIRDLIGRGCKCVDFLRGDHDYKWHWAGGWHETMTGAVFSTGMAGRLNDWLYRTRRLIRHGQTSPAVPPDFVRAQTDREE